MGRLACFQGFRKIWVETDFELAVQFIGGPVQDFNSSAGLIRDI